jgi:hypothetical protein
MTKWAVVCGTKPPVPECYHYNVYIVLDGWYCGIGRWCETWDEVVDYCKIYGVEEIRKEGDL